MIRLTWREYYFLIDDTDLLMRQPQDIIKFVLDIKEERDTLHPRTNIHFLIDDTDLLMRQPQDIIKFKHSYSGKKDE